MSQTKAPKLTPSPKRPDTKSKRKVVDQAKRPQALFVSLALDMSWRLALVVLVPIIGGTVLDNKLKTSPLLFITGFILAMVGMGLVMWRTLQQANALTMPTPKKGSHS